MKKKNIKKRQRQFLLSLFAGFLFIIPFTGKAQYISPDVLCSGGGSLSTSFLSLDFSIGQITDELLADSGILLSQGFLQGEDFNTISEEFQLETILKVYPVPAQNKLFIKNNSTEKECFFIIRNMQGKTVQNGNLTNKISSVDISNLKAGIYLIAFYSKEHQLITKKIIKQ